MSLYSESFWKDGKMPKHDSYEKMPRFEVGKDALGFWYAVCPSYPGFFCAGADRDALLKEMERRWNLFVRGVKHQGMLQH